MSDPPAYRHPPYQGGQGGSNLKSIFNLIITSYLIFADLAAEKPLAAERNGHKVEIKSFLSPSPMRDFEIALGQYILYRNLISLTEPEYQIYLAIKDSIYENFFQRESIQAIVKINQLLLLVVEM